MATMDDIARKAGVSHGTVSNVLNKRGNVSAKKIKLVEDAARALGYYVNESAQTLRKGMSKVIHLIIPFELRRKYDSFVSGAYLAISGTDYKIELTYFRMRQDLDNLVEQLATAIPSAIFCLGAAPKQAILDNYKVDTPLLLVDCLIAEQPLSSRVYYIDFNQETVGHMLRAWVDGNQRVVVLSDRQGFQVAYESLIQSLLPESEITVIGIEGDYKWIELADILDDLTENDIVVALSPSYKEQLEELSNWLYLPLKCPVIVLGELTPFHECPGGVLNLKQLGYRALQQVCQQVYQSEILPVDIPVVSSPLILEESKPLRFLTIGTPMTQAIKKIAQRYEKVCGVPVQVEELGYEAMYDLLNQYGPIDADIVRLDIAGMRSVDWSAFARLDSIPQVARINQSLIEGIPKEYTHVSGYQYALPLDISLQMLFYHKQFFEDKLIQREYFERYREQLAVPTTFAAFDRISQFIQEAQFKKGLVGHSLIQGGPLITYADFVPRLLEKAHQLDETTPDTEIFLECLKAYRESLANSAQVFDGWWGDAAANFASGHSVMEIIFSNYGSDLVGSASHFHSSDIGVSAIPGGRPLLGGGVLCVSKLAIKRPEVGHFLEWLYSDEVAKPLALLGGLLPTSSVVDDPVIQAEYPWLSQLRANLQTGSRFGIWAEEYALQNEVNLGAAVAQALEKQRKKE